MTNKTNNLKSKQTNSITPFELASLSANLAKDKKSHHITVLETSTITTISDYFVIVTVDSRPQMQAVLQSILDTHKKYYGYTPKGIDKDESGQWSVVDYGDVVIHIFTPQARDYYQLDAFWSHGLVIPESQWLTENNLRQVS